MPLDDFFAKKEKKKSRKKQNPENLIKKLVNDPILTNDQEKETNIELSKTVNVQGDDEWEAIDDEEQDIDLASIRINKLSVGETDEFGKLSSKDKSEQDGDAEKDQTKKVWGSKAPEVTAPIQEAPEPKQEPKQDSEAAPVPYVPVHMRQHPVNVIKVPKPDVESASDFPTLDAAGTTKPVTKSPEEKADDSESWEQAGVRKARPIDKLPIAINTTPSAYAPPSLRQPYSPADSTFDNRDGRFRDDRFSNRPARNSAGFASRDQPASDFNWSRGQTVANAGQSSSFSGFAPRVSRESSSINSSSGWDRGSTVKTFRDTGREKVGFELIQSNRFAGFGET